MPTTDPVFIGAIIASIIVGAEWLAAHTRLRIFGVALLVILLGAVASNLGVIPTAAGTPLYGDIFEILAPLSIFWLLLQVNLRHIVRAGTPMLLTFGLGAVGTVLGVSAGIALAGGRAVFGEGYAALGGMFAGTYIGGSINFNAIALKYGVVRQSGAYAGAVAVDNIVTALWMVAGLAGPRLLAPFWPAPRGIAHESTATAALVADIDDRESVDPGAIGLVLGLGLAALLARDLMVHLFARVGVTVPGMLVLTALAVGLAQHPSVARLRGARALGMFAMHAFLTVIGALCSLAALVDIGTLGLRLAVLAGTTVLVHGAVTLAGARLIRVDLATAAVASQANIGGATTALALSRSLHRPDLAVPGILAGSLGTALGTFVGFWLAAVL